VQVDLAAADQEVDDLVAARRHHDGIADRLVNKEVRASAAV
jgi:hypothetical protein